MLVVTNKGTFGISRERSLASSTQSKEECDITIFANVGRTVHRQMPFLCEPV